MKLSFVIPAHNEEAFVGKCLEAILQDVRSSQVDCEIIVVNNASVDRTKEVALSYPGIKVVDEQKKGLTLARQAGYLESTGEIIANVDADNILPQGWSSKVVSEFVNNERLMGLSGPLIFYDLSKFVNFQVKLWYILGYLTYLFNHFIIRKGGMMQGGNFIVRRSALQKIGGYNTSIDFYGEDTDIARRLQKVGYIKFTFNLPMLSSGRRLAREGVISAGTKYCLNYFWVLFFKRPYHNEPTEIK